MTPSNRCSITKSVNMNEPGTMNAQPVRSVEMYDDSSRITGPCERIDAVGARRINFWTVC